MPKFRHRSLSDSACVSLSAVGDLYIGKTLRSEESPAFHAAIERFRDADIRFANLEFQLISSDMPAAALAGGAWAAGPESLGEELAWLGTTVVSTANNHAGDYGAMGMRNTQACLRHLGISYCGTGSDLGQARMPAYANSAGGRVAFISVSSSYMPHARAGAPGVDVQGRPGVSPLRFGTQYHVDAQAYRELARILDKLPVNRAHREHPLQRNDNKTDRPSLDFFGMEFVEDTQFGVESWPAHRDVTDIQASIVQARQDADWVVVSLHTHEYDSAPDHPSGFAQRFAQACIDAGADAVLGHGHHGLRGVEVYEGKPIFHGMGPFVFQPYLFPRQPADFFEAYDLQHASLAEVYAARREAAGFFKHREYWEAMLVHLQLHPGAPPCFRIHPISLWPNTAPEPDGLPHLAEGNRGREILAKIQALSQRLGTALHLNDETLTLSTA